MTPSLSTAPAVLTSFAASMVECIEALTVVLAVGAVRGWRWALTGSAAALGLLLLLVVLFGSSLTRIPFAWVQVAVGTLLLLFGLRWLRKAILRSAGAIPLHDEQAAYVRQTTALRAAGGTSDRGWDPSAFMTAFNIVMMEGIEVVFIVIAIGAGGHTILPASLGAAAAVLIVIALGIAVHRPLANVPENALKFAVGVLSSAFGTFWLGEGIPLQWPAADLTPLGLIAFYFIVAQALVIGCRRKLASSGGLPQPHAQPGKSRKRTGIVARLVRELIALFVDDGMLAAGILIWVACAYASAFVHIESAWVGGMFTAGLAALLVVSVLRVTSGWGESRR